jgi:fructose-bisphosphate aldolase class II
VKPGTKELLQTAWRARTVIPALNVPNLPMMEPIVQALRDTRAFGLIQVARLEWEKFQAKSLRAIRDEYERVKDERFTRLHLDHVPVIDEDKLCVDYKSIISEAIELGYESVMLDGSRLPLAENIAATRWVVERSHAAGIPAEAELGAVLGHEAGPLPPYEELFASRKGFTDPDDAGRFARETGVDWLSVAVGNIHGAVSAAAKGKKKVAARLDIDHLDRLREATGVPLVLHGGSGIPKSYVLEAVRHGIAKINIGTSLRQAYEAGIGESIEAAQEKTYKETARILTEDLELSGSADVIHPQ